jgi:hypothetical protein
MGEHDVEYRVVGLNTLFGNPESTMLVPVFDTAYFTVKAVPPIITRITNVELIRVIGNRIEVIDNLSTEHDSIKLGERLRLTAEVEGREEGFEHYVFRWLTPEDLNDYPNPHEFAGYVPNRTDTLVAHSGLIFYPQWFFFSADDTRADGCFTVDGVQIDIRQLIQKPSDFGVVPGAFSPTNNDGINDFFMEGVDEITILNRWGIVIYEAIGERAKQGWDGRDQRTNRIVDRGDYFYIITIYDNNDNTKRSTKTGVVTVF